MKDNNRIRDISAGKISSYFYNLRCKYIQVILVYKWNEHDSESTKSPCSYLVRKVGVTSHNEAHYTEIILFNVLLTDGV